MAAKTQATRAPGYYQDIVDTLLAHSALPEALYDDKPKPQWLMDLERTEQQEVLALLQLCRVSREELVQISVKLEAISPQLTPKETAKLKLVTEPHLMLRLAEVQTATLEKIVSELLKMGASEQGLRRNGIALPKDL